MTCQKCSAENVEVARYCATCGTHLVGKRSGGYAVQNGEQVGQLALISTILPHTNTRTADQYRWAVIGSGALILAAAAFGFVPLALVSAAVLVPLLLIVYMRNVNLWQDAPVAVMLGLFVVTGLLATLVSLVFFQWVFGDQFTQFQAAATGSIADVPLVPLLVFALLLPLVTEVVKQVAPVLLARRPQFDDMIDGLTFGVAAGAAYAAFETIIVFSALFRSGDFRIEGGIATWIVVIANLMVVKSLVYGTATGIAVASFSGIGDGYDGFTRKYFTSFALAAGASVAYWLGIRLLAYAPFGQVLGLLWGLVILALLVVRVRVVLNAAVLEAALEAAASGGGSRTTDTASECPECENPLLPGSQFCVACGTSVRATSPALRSTMHTSRDTSAKAVARTDSSLVSVVAAVAAGVVAAGLIGVVGVAATGDSVDVEDLEPLEVVVTDPPVAASSFSAETPALSPEPVETDAPEPAPSDPGSQDPGGTLEQLADGTSVWIPDGWKYTEPGQASMRLYDTADQNYAYVQTVAVPPTMSSGDALMKVLPVLVPTDQYTNLQTSEVDPLQPFGSVVSGSQIVYKAMWTDPQGTFEVVGNVFVYVRQDGTALILLLEHTPPDNFDAPTAGARLTEVLAGTASLFGAS